MGKIRAKMPQSQRAKQFAPFDAVVGLRQALKEKEKIRIPKSELFDDRIEEINNTLKSINNGDKVFVVYYNSSEQEYLTVTEKVKKINPEAKSLILETVDIKFKDIYLLEK